jgi:hypothetical protein
MTRPASLVAGFLALGFSLVANSAAAQSPRGTDRVSLRFVDDVRRASVSWERRTNTSRQVVDVVCLVPDMATFLDAIATWDDRRIFPILIDDAELTFKFLKAFRPSWVVRYPRAASPIPENELWSRAVQAVGRSWVNENAPGTRIPGGDQVPTPRGTTTPGVVFSSSKSPMLAGAVALAAGRLQPLINWHPQKHRGDVLSENEADDLARNVEEQVGRLIPNYDRLDDDCDFLTVPDDWPYRREGPANETDPNPGVDRFLKSNRGPHAVDDLLGRSHDRRSRWAFVGRLPGDSKSSVYRAMCALFLQPNSAILIDSYDQNDRNWSAYKMDIAARTLARVIPATHRAGDRANLAGWHQVFDPVNPFGLVLINSHGDPGHFHVSGATGSTNDIPPSLPAAVLMIHSFSATDPNDPHTIAGRWLANGAFVYYGSMNEPSLGAFRTPGVVASLIAEGVPLSAAVRESPPEGFGRPWRLVYLGDPLYRVLPETRTARIRPDVWPTIANWPRYAEVAAPARDAADGAKLPWLIRTMLSRLQRQVPPKPLDDLVKVLLSMRRDRLGPKVRPYFDAVQSNLLFEAGLPGPLAARLARIPSAERTPDVVRWLETAQLMVLEKRIAAMEFDRAVEAWSEVVRSNASREFLEHVTGRVGALADITRRRATWSSQLQRVQATVKNSGASAILAAERKRVASAQ